MTIANVTNSFGDIHGICHLRRYINLCSLWKFLSFFFSLTQTKKVSKLLLHLVRVISLWLYIEWTKNLVFDGRIFGNFDAGQSCGKMGNTCYIYMYRDWDSMKVCFWWQRGSDSDNWCPFLHYKYTSLEYIHWIQISINKTFFFSSFFAEWALVNILRLFPGTPPLTIFTSQGKSYITWRKNNNKIVHIIFHSQHTSALINFASFEHCVDTKLRSFRCNWKPLATQAGEICVIPMHKKRTTYTFRIKHKKGKCSYIVSNEKRLLFPNIHTQNLICWLMGIACWTSFVEYKYCFWCIWQEQKKKKKQSTNWIVVTSFDFDGNSTHTFLPFSSKHNRQPCVWCVDIYSTEKCTLP